MKYCENCGKSSKEALIYEVITRLGLGQMCRQCVDSEKLPIAKNPNEDDAKEFFEDRQPKPTQNVKDKLVANFHWNLQTGRRRTKLSTKQLAEEIGESEEAIKTLEAGKVLDEKTTNRLVKKLEQFLRVKVKKEDEFIGNDLQLVNENILNEEQ